MYETTGRRKEDLNRVPKIRRIDTKRNNKTLSITSMGISFILYLFEHQNVISRIEILGSENTLILQSDRCTT